MNNVHTGKGADFLRSVVAVGQLFSCYRSGFCGRSLYATDLRSSRCDPPQAQIRAVLAMRQVVSYSGAVWVAWLVVLPWYQIRGQSGLGG